MPEHYIVMGDIIKSRKYAGDQLMEKFKMLILNCNTDLSDGILSPYTITLGDEFQGVSKSLKWSVKSIIRMEEAVLRDQIPFRLRYVVHYGIIESPINPEIAHAMIGPGLTRARGLLTDKRRGQPRFRFDLANARLATQLTRLFGVMSSLTRAWKTKEIDVIFDMIANNSDAQVGAKYHKDRTQIWKLRNSLFIDEYKALRDTILELSQEDGEA